MPAIRRTIRRILPEPVTRRIDGLRSYLRLVRHALDDLSRFARYSSAVRRNNDQTQLEALLVLGSHKLEKGLSLRQRRLQFGLGVVAELQNNLLEYQRRYGFSDIWSEAFSTLEEYYAFHEGKASLEPELLSQFGKITELSKTALSSCGAAVGGTRTMRKKDIDASTAMDYEAFFLSRYSIRDYADRDVDTRLIADAAAIAQKAPSVCNRQAWALQVLTDPEEICGVLDKHGGARGFSGSVNKLLVITTDMKAFYTVGERNQAWVDGGIYAMSLLAALHAKGLGACCLNWCVPRGVDAWFREKMAVPDSCVVICLISVGHLPDEFRVAISPRKPVEQVVTIRNDRT